MWTYKPSVKGFTFQNLWTKLLHASIRFGCLSIYIKSLSILLSLHFSLLLCISLHLSVCLYLSVISPFFTLCLFLFSFPLSACKTVEPAQISIHCIISFEGFTCRTCGGRSDLPKPFSKNLTNVFHWFQGNAYRDKFPPNVVQVTSSVSVMSTNCLEDFCWDTQLSSGYLEYDDPFFAHDRQANDPLLLFLSIYVQCTQYSFQFYIQNSHYIQYSNISES